MIISKGVIHMKGKPEFKPLEDDLKRIIEDMGSLPTLDWNGLDAGKTAHIAVDMVNGFVKPRGF